MQVTKGGILLTIVDEQLKHFESIGYKSVGKKAASQDASDKGVKK